MGIVPYLDSVRIQVEYVNLVDLFLNEIFVEYLICFELFLFYRTRICDEPCFFVWNSYELFLRNGLLRCKMDNFLLFPFQMDTGQS